MAGDSAFDIEFGDAFNNSGIADGGGGGGGVMDSLGGLAGMLGAATGNPLLAAVPALAGMFGKGGSGGAKNTSQSSSSVAVSVNPNISVYNQIGGTGGSPSLTSGGGASATSNPSQYVPDYVPSGSYGSPLNLPVGSYNPNASNVQPQQAGIFDSPLVLIAIAVGGFFLLKEAKAFR